MSAEEEQLEAEEQERQAARMRDTPVEDTVMVDDDGSLDQMVQAASIPSLASLVQRGKDAGLIKPMQGYTA